MLLFYYKHQHKNIFKIKNYNQGMVNSIIILYHVLWGLNYCFFFLEKMEKIMYLRQEQSEE